MLAASMDYENEKERKESEYQELCSVIHDSSKFRELLEEGADVNYFGPRSHSLLEMALMNRQYDIVYMLLQCNADPNKWQTIRPIEIAVQNKDVNGVKLLMKYGAKVDVERGNIRPLEFAIQNEEVDMVKLLLEYGAKVDVETKGTTYLHMAARKTNNIEVVKLLVNHGAKVWRLDEHGKTALDVCVEDDNKVKGFLKKELANEQKEEGAKLASVLDEAMLVLSPGDNWHKVKFSGTFRRRKGNEKPCLDDWNCESAEN